MVRDWKSWPNVWLKYCFADDLWGWKQDEKGEQQIHATGTCPSKEAETFIMPLAWHFSDHWSFDLSVSHLVSVAKRVWMSFSTATSKQRYYRPIEWKDGVAGVLLLQLSTWGPVSGWPRLEPHFVWEFLEYPVFGTMVEEAKKITQVVMPFPEGFRLPFFNRPAIFGPLLWSLNCRNGYKLSRTLVAMLIHWCPKMSHALRCSDSGGYVERSFSGGLMIFWRRCLEFFVKVWVSGAQIHFSLRNLGNLFIWSKRIPFVTCFLDVDHFSDSQPHIDRGIGA